MKNFEGTIHGIKYMNTYLEAGFPRVICDTVNNRKKVYIQEACTLFLQGVKVKHIAKKFDICESTIHRWLKDSGLKKTTKKMTFKSGGRFAHLR